MRYLITTLGSYNLALADNYDELIDMLDYYLDTEQEVRVKCLPN